MSADTSHVIQPPSVSTSSRRNPGPTVCDLLVYDLVVSVLMRVWVSYDAQPRVFPKVAGLEDSHDFDFVGKSGQGAHPSTSF